MGTGGEGGLMGTGRGGEGEGEGIVIWGGGGWCVSKMGAKLYR
jgi:hypothetical protein